MQYTYTLDKVRYTARKIDQMMDKANMTVGDDYIIFLGNHKFFANYRQIQDPPYAPTCDRPEANAIALMPDDGYFKWKIWLDFDPRYNREAAILGAITSEKKRNSSAANGRKGGRPRKS